MAATHNKPKPTQDSAYVDAPESSVSSDSQFSRHSGDYAPHIWQSLDNINRELGGISNKLESFENDLVEIKKNLTSSPA